jgi:hypothetical protein
MSNYTRKQGVITNTKTNESTNYGADQIHAGINAAKRESRKLQKTGHTVRVIK